LFAGISLTGAVVQQDEDSTRTIYRKMIEQRQILSGSVTAPRSAASFMSAVSRASKSSRDAQAKRD
jgi:lipid-binding SYLF domain-containing protein